MSSTNSSDGGETYTSPVGESMSLSTLKPYADSGETLPFESIGGIIIPTLINHLSEAKDTLISNKHLQLQQQEAGVDSEYEKRMVIQIDALRRDLIYIDNAFTGLQSFEKSASDLFKILLQPQHSLHQLFHNHVKNAESKKIQEYKLRVLHEIMKKVKLLIPSSHKMMFNKPTSSSLTAGMVKELDDDDNIPSLYSTRVFSNSLSLEQFRAIYNTLSATTKLCLLCFAVFPARQVIKKRLLIHWWVGEGFVNPPDHEVDDEEKTPEQIAAGIFQELTMKGCIESVYKKRRSDVQSSYTMGLIIHFAVIEIAKEVGFFNFDDKGNPVANFSWSRRACLRRGSHLDQDAEKLETIFNVSESYPDFSNVECSKLRNLKVLYLGRWHSNPKRHIELAGDNVEFLKGLRFMKHLRFFSLRGMSSIMKLPGSVCKQLVSLRTLDLGACHNLEKLPETIGLLKTLTHLDVSECYLLERMPKGIASLSQLQVLKGFIITADRKNDTQCSVHDLALGVQKLKKLTIRSSREDFPKEEEVISLQRIPRLVNLTIAWGWLDKRSRQDRITNVVQQSTTTASQHPATPKTGGAIKSKRMTRSNAMIREYFKQLEKLDLQCYPRMIAPNWLTPGKLKSLKKLYIRGGPLQKLGHELVPDREDDKWTVETIRFKFLSWLKMDWEEIRATFPKLIYLEKFRCPKLTFFPCDQSGVWMK